MDIYKIGVSIHVCDDEKEVLLEYKRLAKKHNEHKEADDTNYEMSGCVFNPDDSPYTFYLLLSRNNLDVNTITHETDHLRNYIMDVLSLYEDSEAKEASANLNGYINEKVFRFLKNSKIPFKI